MDVASGTVVEGPIDRTRYSPVAWLPGAEAFYYVRRVAPDGLPVDEQQFHRRVWLHRVGTDPEQDVLVFGDGLDKTNYYGVSVSMDGPMAVHRCLRGHRHRATTCGSPTSRSRPRTSRSSRWCSRASTPARRCTSGVTAGPTCSPTAMRRAAGWP
jgi:prolyl oligopeptidase